jgi:small subunit ribosomal protein S6
MVEPFSPKGGEGMNKYEVLYIIDTDLDEESRIESAGRKNKMGKNLLSSRKGQTATVDEWGVRKLAYPIQKKNEGYYVKMNFSSNPELPKELTRIFRITESVIRYLIIKEDE